MAGEYGRDVEFIWGGSPILGVREKALTIDGEPVNVTSDEDSGWQTLLEGDAETAVNIELSGVTKDSILREAKLTGGAALTNTATLTYSDGGVLTGTFQLAGYSEGQPYNEAVTFTATIMSNGAITYTPPV